ncbi:hypothetical protein [Alteromonas oceanisediminis]|uniref:hypothetical protein n=1 Tax=Alteromonas oceanisediminis TaxID=2836180 RepID=UPI001BDAE127|nr:hypothetical protein [Alteromonas oceanisediminis]MBT0585603.1 hypothetical protein [Alteromonas oceanisediminis]
MNTLKIGFISLGFALLTACASSSSWNAVTDLEQARWESLNINERTAMEYIDNGLDANDVERWMNKGFVEQEDIIRWSKSQFTVFEASNWRMNGFEADEARAWAQENFTPEDAGAWKQKNFDLEDAIEERAKGLAPTK